MNALTIVFSILGLAAGGGLGYLVKALITKFQMVTMENKLHDAEKAKEQAINEANAAKNLLAKTQTLLSDTLASIELLKAYQAIDQKTKDQLKQLQDSMKDGKVTDDTMLKYKKMIEEMNKKNQAYNQGGKPVIPGQTPAAPAAPVTPVTPVTPVK